VLENVESKGAIVGRRCLNRRRTEHDGCVNELRRKKK